MENVNINNLLIGFAVIVFIGIIMTWLVHDRNKRAREWNKRIAPEYAKKWISHMHQTPPFGQFHLVVSPFKWVIVIWDKHKNELEIVTPPDTFYHKQNNTIKKTWLNWKIIGHKPPVKTTVEEHFKRTRVM